MPAAGAGPTGLGGTVPGFLALSGRPLRSLGLETPHTDSLYSCGPSSCYSVSVFPELWPQPFCPVCLPCRLCKLLFILQNPSSSVPSSHSHF